MLSTVPLTELPFPKSFDSSLSTSCASGSGLSTFLVSSGTRVGVVSEWSWSRAHGRPCTVTGLKPRATEDPP
ncbi:hypothetical protein TNCV_4872071 [Trichonephila clavipes]|nr:hypothetical protein TNCV_4872071 [Trichonephila clavipes]